ncbi:Pycsar system effector family protein [Actinoplanes awajinensis]|uniref:Pycsar effector protein domain-containing protein n=1 Tax=Actinoplanes awajinensis subsp. mycoplanecinus TaxID=135947 RepID=A0A0X3UNT5_9ACTN|nr:Pycsar system effector family protein [Actinoplanes awajinensis]KUL34160.1 hypothetical protein ADL15_16955 [Actinoplanes awajinensis subsp. mycoplanecinus]
MTNNLTTTENSITTEKALAEVQAQISRVDTKASILTGLALGALTGGAALASKAHLHGFSLVTAVATAALIGAAIVLLGVAIRPALGGNYGFMRWASAPSARALGGDWTLQTHTADSPARTDADVTHLWLLARSTRRKYQRVRLAVDLLGAALGCAALTAFLSALN